MATTTRTIEMANFASDGDSMTKTVSLPDYVDLQNVSVDVEAAGDLNSSSENFDYYLDGSLEGGELSTGVQDCTYRDVWTNRDVTNYFDGKSSVQLQVNSSPATDEGFDCTGTAIKVKSVFTIDYVSTSPPSSPQNPASTYIADDQIDFSFDAPSDWGGETGDYEVQMLRDSGSWSDPAGGPSAPSSAGTYSYGPNSDTAYGRQVGIDSSFQFRVRATNSAGSSSWVSSSTVYTTPIPPHNPSVSRPDANTVEFNWENKSDITSNFRVTAREDDGSGYGEWGYFANYDDATAPITESLDSDKRYQFRFRHYVRNANGKSVFYGDQPYVYADYGNEGNVYFEDDFESGDLSAWDGTNISGDTGVTSSGDPSNDIGINGSDDGSYWFYGEGTAGTEGTWIKKNLGDLSGETDVLVKCAFGFGSLDNGSENFGISWYDGSTWQSLDHKDWEYNKQGWVELQATVQSSWLSSDNRIRIGTTTGSGMYGGDHFGVDRVVVSDILHEYTKPAAPTNVSASRTSNSHEVSVSWDKQVASLPEAFQEVRVRVDGSGDPRDKYNVNLSSSATFNVNDGFDHTVPQRDGEQYEIRVDSLFQQFRHGTTENYPRSVSGDTTAITKLPAPTSLSVSNIGINSAGLSWTDNHDYGNTEVQFKLDSDTTWTTDNTVSIGTQSETFTSLSEATVYDARVLASTEHTTTEDI